MYPNLKILEFKKSIETYVNESDIPEMAKQLVLESILKEQIQKTLNMVNKELNDRDKDEQGEKR